ncbi:hypothetical protein PF010_g7270 [Phytophthora fragariae]|uniref:Uncharacterized protein n=1 Tax=Phytophthora fragariae TaxID=53985 RepID=A0A6A3UM55_9STRA|nr:hypothetical protein PF009_g8735 [Phytophthora fragariae]KAE9121025.1 hypothetical protein PF010_g7270 [Phytophthora fragariae]KAE9148132.1 hypothetical protein PF006_g7250 [Phytophthora fragariae]KAE9241934.1 hypothetical protein PF002_g9014 [Phytophthora fragariae]KAE9242017.1 hypothetical protein PF004_g6799 [Phytophthora fragariae]
MRALFMAMIALVIAVANTITRSWWRLATRRRSRIPSLCSTRFSVSSSRSG